MSHELLELPAEVLVVIATQLPVVDFIHFQQTNKKLWEHLSHPSVFQKLMAATRVPEPYSTEMLKSLEDLFLFQQIRGIGLLDENRIGVDVLLYDPHNEDVNEFGLASLRYLIFKDDDDKLRDDTDIRKSQARIAQCQQLLRRYPCLTISIDSHCGIACDNDDMATQVTRFLGRHVVFSEFYEFFSRPPETNQTFVRAWGLRALETAASFRGGDVLFSPFYEFFSRSPPDTNRTFVRAWGLRALEAATRLNDHKYVARASDVDLLGWVELRIGILGRGEFQVPCLPVSSTLFTRLK